MRNPASLPSAAISLAIRVYDASGNQISSRVVLQSASVGADGWQKLTGNFTVPAGAAFIAVDVGGATGTGSWFVDDVAITRPVATSAVSVRRTQIAVSLRRSPTAPSTTVYDRNGA